MSQFAEVVALHIYPVKSLAGISLNTSELTPTGLSNDRRWMVVLPNGRQVTQRQIPLMATIQTTLENNQLILSKQGQPDLTITPRSGNSRQVVVWRDTCNAIDEGDEASQWLTKNVQSPNELRLVRIAEGFTRPQSKPHLLGDQTSTMFADSAPFLITNPQSLESLNQSLRQSELAPVTMDRFRPNIVVSGLNEFEEHHVKIFSHDKGLYELQQRFPSERCVTITVDQKEGIKDPHMQPYNTLSKLNPVPDNPNAAAFGENAILSTGEGQWINVGDKLLVGK